MTVLDTQLPPDPMLERRRLVQEASAKKLRGRKIRSSVFMSSLSAALVVSVIPLGFIIAALISKGASVISGTFLTATPIQPNLLDQDNIGGIGNAITGSLLVDGVAALIAVPLGVLIGLYLSESDSRPSTILRTVAEIMTGLPSILFGVFSYIYIVTAMKGYSALAASIALSMLMTPVITKAAETALRDVPVTLKEAGLALGARQSKVTLKVILPYAFPGVFTGVLLALARAIGETAPLLFVIGASIIYDWNPTHPNTAMPLMIFNYAGSFYESQQAAAWGVALTLVTIVFALNMIARLVAARMRREQR
jgi:phosphate transport system permease protein